MLCIPPGIEQNERQKREREGREVDRLVRVGVSRDSLNEESMTHENAASFAWPESVPLSVLLSSPRCHVGFSSFLHFVRRRFISSVPSLPPSPFHSSRLIYANWPPAVINRDYGHVLRKLVSTSVLGRPYRDSISSILVAHAPRPHPPAFLAPLFLFPSCFLSFS